MNIIIGLIVGLVFFIATIIAYTIGLKHGRQIQQGNTPKVNINPVKAIVEAVEQHEQKQEGKKADGELADIMSYSAESALMAIKKGDA
jgi:hypothetical protein